MRRIKIATGVLAAVCTSFAIAPSAFAVEKKGEIVNKNGGVPTKGQFLGTSSTPGEFESTGGSKYKCTGLAVTGKITSKTAGMASYVFTGCTNASGNCSTSGGTAKEIKMGSVALTNVAKEGKDYILNNVPEFTFHCGTETIHMKGSFYMSVSPEGRLVKTTERAKFMARGQVGKQTPEESTNHLVWKFNSKSFENLSLNIEGLEVAFEEEVEFI